MTQNISVWCWQFSLISSLAITGTFVFSEYFALAQIKEDGTLGTNSSIVTPKLINGQHTDQIDGGAIHGTNLFHSFEQFSVLTGSTVYFNNGANIDNIITRVTGKSISNIDGTLRANGTANLFLINPNGIIFGANASLNIGGSFVASTASNLNFADGTKFSATDAQTTPLLTVSVPIGLQFGTKPGTIYNQSQASPGGAINYRTAPVGLQVQSGKTLALVGGDLLLEGGNLTAKGGRIELASVGENGLVKMKQTDQGWVLGYEGVKNFQDIRLVSRTQIPSYVDVSGEGGGNIVVQGRHVLLTGSSQILANSLSGQLPVNLTVTASDTVELIGPGRPLTVGTFGGGGAGNLTINTKRFIVSNGAQVFVDNSVSDSVAQLTVNASDSVELIGGFSFQIFSPNDRFISSGLFSATYDVGNAGNITINTQKLSIREGAQVSTRSDGRFLFAQNQFKPATGQGGNLTVNASKLIELSGISANGLTPSSLSASTKGSGSAGNLDITTGLLIVRNGAAISVSSEVEKNVNYQGDVPNLGLAGALNITADSILLDKGTLTSNSESGKGGNISLQLRDLLLMRRNSQISTNAGGDKTGGNITINAPNGFIVAPVFGNSDITANAFSGPGGKIAIATKNIFGFVPRTRADLERLNPDNLNPNDVQTNDITAFSQQNPSLTGTVQINSPDVDPSKGLVELPVNLVDASRQIAAGCGSGAKMARSSFNNTGRGGTAPNPTEPLTADAVLADWITLNPESENRAEGMKNRVIVEKQRNIRKSQKVNFVNEPSEIVEAQGWIFDASGNVVLVAEVPTGMPHSSWLTAASCTANG
ncbi:MAG: filamentous hemagglutinin N-terminal domain-containing protein [Nostoc sp. CreGUA01]|nr:filamentous hemagglutinin N-terminal domain-containing protein [Nostoc sp. CreGUA01]